LQLCTELQSLVFGLSDNNRDLPLHLPQHLPQQFRLDKLLSLKFTVQAVEGADLLPLISAQWAMPALRYLSIYEYGHGLIDNFPDRYREQFISTFGCTLVYLHMRRLVSPKTRRIDMQRILDSCPLLEHLVLDPMIESTSPISHPMIKWIDLWGRHNHRDLRPSLTLDAFSALRGIRVLDLGLSISIEWALVFLPVPSMEDLSFEYPGLHIQTNVDGIYKKDPKDADDISTSTICHPDIVDDSSDESFRHVERGSDGNTSDESWSSDELNDDSEVASEATDWANHEMALTLFHAMQE